MSDTDVDYFPRFILFLLLKLYFNLCVYSVVIFLSGFILFVNVHCHNLVLYRTQYITEYVNEIILVCSCIYKHVNEYKLPLNTLNNMPETHKFYKQKGKFFIETAKSGSTNSGRCSCIIILFLLLLFMLGMSQSSDWGLCFF
jgi:hypothetical protein